MQSANYKGSRWSFLGCSGTALARFSLKPSLLLPVCQLVLAAYIQRSLWSRPLQRPELPKGRIYPAYRQTYERRQRESISKIRRIKETRSGNDLAYGTTKQIGTTTFTQHSFQGRVLSLLIFFIIRFLYIIYIFK